MHKKSLATKLDFKGCIVEEDFEIDIHDACFCLLSMAGTDSKHRGLSLGAAP
jgi:hypothetical protein